MKKSLQYLTNAGFVFIKSKAIIFAFLTLFIVFPSAAENVASQSVKERLTVKNVTVANIIEELNKQTGYEFSCDAEILNKKVSLVPIDVENKDIETILTQIFDGTDISFKVTNKLVLLRLNQETVNTVKTNKNQQQEKTVTGSVVDTNGESIIGASIVLKNDPSKGVVTNIYGEFNIPNVNSTTILVFTYVGMQSQEILVDDQQRIDVVMQEDAELLDELVVVGFGKQKKASVTAAITTISSKELRVPASNLSTAFAGRIAGVTSVQRSGEPGADGASFWIRGISTFASQTQPLIFIDGVEVSTADMNALAPEVIDNFSVLKDATATALYGARGANGVMLITTREGHKSEKASINIRVENSFTAPTSAIELADGVDYMYAYNNAIANRSPGSPPRFSEEKIQNTIDQVDPYIFPNVDWQNVLFKESSIKQAANVNVIGGGEKVTYFMSASLNNDIGMLRKDPYNAFDNNIRNLRITMQGNITANLTPTTKVTLRLNNQIIQTRGSSAGTSTIYSELFYTPPVLFPVVYPALNQEDHILFGNSRGGPHPTASGDNIYNNPYATMVRGYSNRNQSTSISTLEIDQDLKFMTPGLRIKGLISFKNWSSTNIVRSFTPFFYALDNYEKVGDEWTYDYSVATKGTTALSTSTGTTGDRLLNLQLNLDYNRTFGLHDISGMFVYLQRDYNSNAPGTFYDTLPIRNQGVAGRATYGFDNRYLLELNFGYNGSENFQDGKRWGFFPSVAVGYNISNEKFFAPITPIISSLKIRGSYGLVGNSDTYSRFPYITEVNLEGRGYIFGDNWQVYNTGAVVTKYGSEGASWEVGHKKNLGVDMELFNSLSITADFFNEVRDGIFMQRRVIPAETGVVGTNPWGNMGKVKNKGVDISIGYNKAFTKDVLLSVRGSLTLNYNTLLDRDEPQLPYDYLSDINKPLNRYKGLIAEGLFKDEEDINNSPRQTYGDYKPGDIKYKDLNDDGQIDDLDITQIGDPTIPQLVYGFGASLQVKSFDVSFFMQGIGRTSLMMSGIHPFLPEGSGLFQFIADDYWTEENPNPNAAYPRLMHGAATHNNFRNSTYWLRDASFLRLKNVELGYTYKMARLYLNGQNLLLFSPFKLWDPESGGGNGMKYPPSKLINIGIQLTF